MVIVVTGVGVVTSDALESPPVAELLRGDRVRSLNREARLLLAAARRALSDAGHGRELPDPDRLGIVVASCHAGHDDYAALFLAGIDPGGPHVSPTRGPQTGLNAPAAQLSIRLPAGGPNATVSNGAVGGLDALAYARDALAAGRASAMLVGAVDVLPGTAGGAAVLVLEPADAARVEPGLAHAAVAGVATALAPDDDLAAARARSLRDALVAAGVAPDALATTVDVAAAGHVESTAAVVQLGAAASRLRRRELRGSVAVRASDDAGGAGAAVLVGEAA